MSIRRKTWHIIAFYFLSLSILNAQRTQYYTDSERALKDGIDLFQKQKYGDAKSRFYDLLQSDVPLTEYARSEATYYYAAASVELFHEDGEYLMKHFITSYPESPKVVQAHFQLAKLYFRKKEWENVIRELNESDVFLLSKDEYFEYYYKLGYSQFMLDDLDAAIRSFKPVTEKINPYQAPAIYYYAHINYRMKKYEEALKYFLMIKDHKTFAHIVPFYIAQIYYIEGKYEETIAYAEPLVDTLKGKNVSIVRRILAESYYEVRNYPKATENYEQYLQTGSGLDRDGNYRLGLCYYNAANYPKAAEYLQYATSEQDSMSQSAYYYLADCFLKTDQKLKALDPLKLTYTLNFDQRLSKQALFNFAKLSYETGYDPYNEAIDAIQLYIEKYSKNENLDEAYELMANIYLSLHNYRDALVSLEKIPNKNIALKTAEQRIYLFRGMELFNNLDYDGAITHLEKSIEKNYDHRVSTEAKFWLADAYYRKGEYSKAVMLFDRFLVAPSVQSLAYYKDAYYNLGYAYFKQREYPSALNEFKTFAESPGMEQRKLTDAYVRIGDCYFVAKNYTQALTYYDKAIHSQQLNNDYPYFQKALIQGLTGNNAGKVVTLKEAITKFSDSPYRSEMYYELGVAHQRTGDVNEAVNDFMAIVNSPKPGKFLVNSYLQLGSIYNNNNNYRESLGWFKRVVDEFPGSKESQEAIKSIQTIYVKMGDIDGFNTWTNSLQNVEINQGELDSASYEAAENVYNSGDCARSTDALGKYIMNFPHGAFLLEANHYKAECHYKEKQYDQSLPNFEYIISQKKNDYTENALSKAAWIYETKNDSLSLMRIYTRMEELAESPTLLQKARTGLMKLYFRKGEFETAIRYAKMVQTFDKLDPSVDQLAYYITATSSYNMGQYEDAYGIYKKLAAKNTSPYYPEANYRIAEIQYNKAEYKNAEKTLRNSVKYMGGQKDWLARSFILLSDVYVSMENYVDAKAVLQTVIDNHDGQDLVELARQKLEAIQETERGTNKNLQQNPMEFDMQNGKPTQNQNNIGN